MTCWLCGFETTDLTTDAKSPTCEGGPCHICNAVAKVDEEIDQAVATLRLLLTKRCDLRSEQNRVHEGLIRRLPPELNNYIFELLLPLCDEWGEIVPQTQRTAMPSSLASVCKGWRDVAWSNPSLWSTIHIANWTSDRINFVYDWILRSQSLPLRIVLCTNGHSDEEFQSVIDVIGQCSNRWHSLSVDVPWMSSALHLNKFQYHLLKRLRMVTRNAWEKDDSHSLLFDTNVSPEQIEICGVPCQSLQISWNHLTSAKVENFDLEEITQLFQHASQMSCCHIWYPRISARNFSNPPIIHHRLKILSFLARLCFVDLAPFFDSLTLPSLQEFHTDEMALLTPAYLPTLVHRSSCPIRLTITNFEIDAGFYARLQPLHGVTGIVLEYLGKEADLFEELLLGGYFPDLRHLTVRLEPFLYLWEMGVIIPLLDRKRPRADRPNEGRLCTFLVVDQASKFDRVWNSDVGKQLKALDISVREDGFEFI